MPVPNLMPVPAFRQCAKLAKLTTGVTEQTFQDLPSGHIKHFWTLLFGQNSHYTQTPISSESTYYDSFWFCVSQNCIFVDVFYSRWIGILEAALNHMLPHFLSSTDELTHHQLFLNAQYRSQWVAIGGYSVGLLLKLAAHELSSHSVSMAASTFQLAPRPRRAQSPPWFKPTLARGGRWAKVLSL